MIQYKLSDVFEGTEAIVALDASKPNEYAAIQYSGDEELVNTARSWLTSATGAFGNLIGKRTTAIDLDAAMKTDAAKQFDPQLIKGQRLVNNYDPDIPKDAIS